MGPKDESWALVSECGIENPDSTGSIRKALVTHSPLQLSATVMFYADYAVQRQMLSTNIGQEELLVN